MLQLADRMSSGMSDKCDVVELFLDLSARQWYRLRHVLAVVAELHRVR